MWMFLRFAFFIRSTTRTRLGTDWREALTAPRLEKASGHKTLSPLVCRQGDAAATRSLPGAGCGTGATRCVGDLASLWPAC